MSSTHRAKFLAELHVGRKQKFHWPTAHAAVKRSIRVTGHAVEMTAVLRCQPRNAGGRHSGRKLKRSLTAARQENCELTKIGQKRPASPVVYAEAARSFARHREGGLQTTSLASVAHLKCVLCDTVSMITYTETGKFEQIVLEHLDH